MRVVILILFLIVCMCEKKRELPKVENSIEKAISSGTLSEKKFIDSLNGNKWNAKQLSKMSNDTSLKDTYRRLSLYYLVENYCFANMTISKCRNLFDSPTWLTRKNATTSSLYSGPPPSFFDDTTSGMFLIIRPLFSELDNSRICIKVGFDESYKGIAINEEVLYGYLKGNYKNDSLDSLLITNIKVEKQYGNNYL